MKHISFEIAQQLKQAGFPQDHKVDQWVYTDKGTVGQILEIYDEDQFAAGFVPETDKMFYAKKNTLCVIPDVLTLLKHVPCSLDYSNGTYRLTHGGISADWDIPETGLAMYYLMKIKNVTP